MDRIYYFSTGDFQSWFEPGVKSNIARVFMGHDRDSLNNSTIPLSQCKLTRDVCLLTPDSYAQIDDSNNISFAQYKANPAVLEGDPNDADNGILNISVPTEMSIDPDNVRRLMCENVGEFRIEWTYGFDLTGALIWQPQGTGSAWITCGPDSSNWPKAIKFTFTLYDSKGILDGGRRFTHIVYLD
jgi:hypothetical protein